MDRVVRINVKNINIGTGLLISLNDDQQKDIILTVCHIFGEDKDNLWEMWEVEPEDVEITSDYYGVQFRIVSILYKNSDADEKDIALIYIEKANFTFDSPNLSTLNDNKQILGKSVFLEGYGREEFNNTSRVINGTIHNFINADKIMYRINYMETDRIGATPTWEINKGMSGAPVYFSLNNNRIFVGMQKMVSSVESTDGILGAFTYDYCIKLVSELYEVQLPFESGITNLIKNEPLFRNIHLIQQEFNIIPANNKHIGASIEYEDIKELREEFIEELINTIVDWLYGLERYNELKQQRMEQGCSESSSTMALTNKVRRQFRRETNGNYTARIRMCDLLLFHFIQRCMKASPLLRKENIYANNEADVASADVLHYKYEEGKNNIILGKAMIFTNKYKFEEAFSIALEGILEAYNTHRQESHLYVHQDFLSKEMDAIAESYINGTMRSPKIHLVNFIMYEEYQKLSITEEEDIRNQIDTIIRRRYEDFADSNIDIENNPILNRITYIIFPTWNLEELVEMFREYI